MHFYTTKVVQMSMQRVGSFAKTFSLSKILCGKKTILRKT